ncbi:MAG: hypothetical protein HZB82_06285 [Deltaproteobacteria bacterium]|nr:hypothetical protein [Deltaproteobacteria bacterium]
MPTETFEAFKSELFALRDILSAVRKKTIRDELLLDRFRTLFRSWAAIVRPTIEPLLSSKRDFLKLGAELETLARLTSKYKHVADYRKRLNTAITLVNALVLYLPPAGECKPAYRPSKDGLYLPAIPDLPVNLVPNPLLGWKSNIATFLNQYPFDKSVFIMIRYRDRNKCLIKTIKSVLLENGLNGILASEHNLTDDLYNPIACLLSCSKGIAIFDEAEADQEFNPNVAYELGMLHLLCRGCLLLKHRSLTTLHADILMKLYKDYETLEEARTKVQDWIKAS